MIGFLVTQLKVEHGLTFLEMYLEHVKKQDATIANYQFAQVKDCRFISDKV